MVNMNSLTSNLVRELAFTEEEIQELKAARGREIIFDEDCPETTPEKALMFRRVNPPREKAARA